MLEWPQAGTVCFPSISSNGKDAGSSDVLSCTSEIK